MNDMWPTLDDEISIDVSKQKEARFYSTRCQILIKVVGEDSQMDKNKYQLGAMLKQIFEVI